MTGNQLESFYSVFPIVSFVFRFFMELKCILELICLSILGNKNIKK